MRLHSPCSHWEVGSMCKDRHECRIHVLRCLKEAGHEGPHESYPWDWRTHNDGIHDPYGRGIGQNIDVEA